MNPREVITPHRPLQLPAKLAATCALIATLAGNPGDLDESFDPGTGPSGTVAAVVIDLVGKLLVGGSFDAFNGTQVGSLVRLLPDGKVDPDFKVGEGANEEVKAIELLEDGRMFVAGRFTRFGGNEAVGIVMLAPDGSVDSGFSSRFTEKELSAGVACLESFPNGRIAVGGYFNTYGGKIAGRLAFLRPNDE